MDVTLLLFRIGAAVSVASMLVLCGTVARSVLSGEDGDAMELLGKVDLIMGALTVAMPLIVIAEYLRQHSNWAAAGAGVFGALMYGWAKRAYRAWKHRHCTSDHCVYEREEEPAEGE
jgi:hypothetical protein